MLATIVIQFSVDVECKDLKEANYTAAFFIRSGLGSLAPSYKDEDVKLNSSNVSVMRSIYDTSEVSDSAKIPLLEKTPAQPYDDLPF